MDRAHLARASDAGKLIKLADLIDNIIDIDKHDPHLAKVFRKEVQKDIENLRSGNEILFQELMWILS